MLKKEGIGNEGFEPDDGMMDDGMGAPPNAMSPPDMIRHGRRGAPSVRYSAYVDPLTSHDE